MKGRGAAGLQVGKKSVLLGQIFWKSNRKFGQLFFLLSSSTRFFIRKKFIRKWGSNLLNLKKISRKSRGSISIIECFYWPKIYNFVVTAFKSFSGCRQPHTQEACHFKITVSYLYGKNDFNGIGSQAFKTYHFLKHLFAFSIKSPQIPPSLHRHISEIAQIYPCLYRYWINHYNWWSTETLCVPKQGRFFYQYDLNRR